MGDTDLPSSGPMTSEGVIMERLRNEAWCELRAEDKKNSTGYSMLQFDPLREMHEADFADRVEELAESRLK